VSCQEIELERISSGVDALVDVKELAEMLRCDDETIRRMNRAHRLPNPIPGRKSLLWTREVISAWMKAGCPDPISWRCSHNAITALIMGYPIEQITYYGQKLDLLDDIARTRGPITDNDKHSNPFN
jgi:excisionase family DNA binding protein